MAAEEFIRLIRSESEEGRQSSALANLD
jgi:hypothetical protein